MDYNNPLVTIITPVYKAEAFLDRCVKSVVSQSFPNWEILLIDDGSPDGSGEKCDEWGKIDGRIRVFHKSNSGVSSARNLGLNNAKGRYIMFLDSDDWFLDDTVEICVKKMQENDVDVLQFNAYEVTTEGEKKQMSHVFCNACSLEDYVISDQYMVGVCVWQGIYKREIIEENGIRFDEKMKYAEDGVFVCRTLFHSKRMMHIANPLYFYFMNDSSAMHKVDVDAYIDSLLIQIDFLDKHQIFQGIYPNLVTMNVGKICTFELTHEQLKRLKVLWLKYRDNSPYVHINEYHHSRSMEYVFLPLQKYSFTMAWFFTALLTKLFWIVKSLYSK